MDGTADQTNDGGRRTGPRRSCERSSVYCPRTLSSSMSMKSGFPRLEFIVNLTNVTFSLVPFLGLNTTSSPSPKFPVFTTAVIHGWCPDLVWIMKPLTAASGPSPQVPLEATAKARMSTDEGSLTVIDRGPLTPLSLLLGESLPPPLDRVPSIAPDGPQTNRV